MPTTISTNDATVFPIIIPTKSSLQSINFYLFKDKHSITLIDAGYDNEECWQALQQVLRDNHLALGDIDRVILTHHHIDHIGLVNRIVEKSNIPIYAHEKSIPRLKRDETFLTKRAEFFEQLYSEMGCGEMRKPYIERLKQLAKDPSGVKVNGDIALLPEKIASLSHLETPGHAIDHVAFYHQQQKWLFAGDLLLSQTSSNALVEPDDNMKRMPTLVQYRKSLLKCAALDVQVTFPGHQGLIYDHRGLIEQRLKRIDEKARKLKTLIKQGLTTANDVAKTFYKDKYEQQFSLVMSEVIGHLDYLESENKINSTLTNGIRYYTVE